MFSHDARQEINLLCIRVNSMTAVTPSPLKTKLYFDNDFIIDFFSLSGGEILPYTRDRIKNNCQP